MHGLPNSAWHAYQPLQCGDQKVCSSFVHEVVKICEVQSPKQYIKSILFWWFFWRKQMQNFVQIRFSIIWSFLSISPSLNSATSSGLPPCVHGDPSDAVLRRLPPRVQARYSSFIVRGGGVIVPSISSSSTWSGGVGGSSPSAATTALSSGTSAAASKHLLDRSLGAQWRPTWSKSILKQNSWDWDEMMWGWMWLIEKDFLNSLGIH